MFEGLLSNSKEETMVHTVELIVRFYSSEPNTDHEKDVWRYDATAVMSRKSLWMNIVRLCSRCMHLQGKIYLVLM